MTCLSIASATVCKELPSACLAGSVCPFNSCFFRLNPQRLSPLALKAKHQNNSTSYTEIKAVMRHQFGCSNFRITNFSVPFRIAILAHLFPPPNAGFIGRHGFLHNSGGMMGWAHHVFEVGEPRQRKILPWRDGRKRGPT
jgi:hypothetical protein